MEWMSGQQQLCNDKTVASMAASGWRRVKDFAGRFERFSLTCPLLFLELTVNLSNFNLTLLRVRSIVYNVSDTRNLVPASQ
jgi:hypothetical protein